MIIQKRICDNCKKEIEEREDCYYKTNITAVNAGGIGVSNSVSGDFCKECFKDVCEELQNVEPEEETKEEEIVEPDVTVEEEITDETVTSDENENSVEEL